MSFPPPAEQVRKLIGGEVTLAAPSAVVVTAAADLATANIPAPVPAILLVKETDGVKTMSSLDMVAYINSTREPGQPEVLHKNFLAKVPTVLGFSTSAEFLAHVLVPGPNGATRQSPCYNFPRREAILMAMSYSYKLQATVLDAWDAAEAKLAVQAPTPVLGLIPNFDDPIEAAEAWIAQRKQANVSVKLRTRTRRFLSTKFSGHKIAL